MPVSAGIHTVGGNTTPARIIARVRDARNRDLGTLVAHAATDETAGVHWPDEWNRDEAPLLVWELLKTLTFREDKNVQQVQAPRVLLTTGVGDCKSFSVLAAQLLRDAGWNVTLKFIQYPHQDFYGHVYVIASDGARSYIVDGVNDDFDAEFDHLSSIDLDLPPR